MRLPQPCRRAHHNLVRYHRHRLAHYWNERQYYTRQLRRLRDRTGPDRGTETAGRHG